MRKALCFAKETSGRNSKAQADCLGQNIANKIWERTKFY
jgi:hypothetical protein